jgi:hypothetical protein
MRRRRRCTLLNLSVHSVGVPISLFVVFSQRQTQDEITLCVLGCAHSKDIGCKITLSCGVVLSIDIVV